MVWVVAGHYAETPMGKLALPNMRNKQHLEDGQLETLEITSTVTKKNSDSRLLCLGQQSSETHNSIMFE